MPRVQGIDQQISAALFCVNSTISIIRVPVCPVRGRGVPQDKIVRAKDNDSQIGILGFGCDQRLFAVTRFEACVRMKLCYNTITEQPEYLWTTGRVDLTG